MTFDEAVLRKRGWRTDSIWTRRFFYKSFLRLIPLFADTRALSRSQFWPRERLRELQDDRLRALFRDAVRVPYWERIFSDARVDRSGDPRNILAQLPITSKRDLSPHPLEHIARTALLHISDADHTSGSTGTPFHFYQDWHASLRSFAVVERTFRATGPRYPIVYMRARQRNGFTFYKHVWFYVRSFNSLIYRLDDLAELGKRFARGFILYAYTSWVVELVRLMESNGISLPLRAVMVAGEHLTASDRTEIERVTGAEVFTLYASREVGFLGFECEEHAMHLSEEWAYIEIVDAEGRALPTGKEGRIIVTAFDNRVMPFIRYEIGDIGSISDAPCACGRTLRTLDFNGRVAERIELDGRVVSLLDVAYSIGTYRNAVTKYQIVQKGALSFTIRIVPGKEYAQHKENLGLLMVRLLHPRVQVTWEIVESIPEAQSGKAMYFIRDMDGS